MLVYFCFASRSFLLASYVKISLTYSWFPSAFLSTVIMRFVKATPSLLIYHAPFVSIRTSIAIKLIIIDVLRIVLKTGQNMLIR